jgi:DNA-directed RNA polymerase sigma subunit (sigma70/sigma32)
VKAKSEQAMADEYAVKVTVRNNLILRRMKKLGIKSQAELAKLAGVSVHTVNILIGMKKRPMDGKNGEWTDAAFSMSSALQTEPEELWTEKQRGMALGRNSREVSMSEDAVAQLASGNGTEQMVQKVLTSERVAKTLQILTPRQQDIIHRRFFEGETLEEVAIQHGVQRERIRQIEAKALRKLKHPSNAKLLKDLNEEGISYG